MAWPDGMVAFLALRFIGGVASAYVLVLASALVLERLNAVGHGEPFRGAFLGRRHRHRAFPRC